MDKRKKESNLKSFLAIYKDSPYGIFREVRAFTQLFCRPYGKVVWNNRHFQYKNWFRARVYAVGNWPLTIGTIKMNKERRGLAVDLVVCHCFFVLYPQRNGWRTNQKRLFVSQSTVHKSNDSSVWCSQIFCHLIMWILSGIISVQWDAEPNERDTPLGIPTMMTHIFGCHIWNRRLKLWKRHTSNARFRLCGMFV